ncbi:DUF1080 domain-containing protein [Rubinisphaera sp. JC750]|uniref:3-keto-disaccharide hydrolase n=1 Tax=Rubinisphaera sp. JC750 TaxID=2898658 RepID=UPI001F32D211|nr:DUF1080 domain-containing protein [Rubinisphaera sp. JC750]
MRQFSMLLCLSVLVVTVANSASAGEKGWVSLMDGKTMNGWKASENSDSWTVEDGNFVCAGPRSHLFYVGDDKPFENFEFRCQVKTTPGSNAGIYFHTEYQEEGWPKKGYEAQVNNTHKDPKKTGSLYAVENVFEAPAKDGEWFDYHIKVDGKRIVITVNGKECVDFTEEPGREAGKDFARVLDKGTFALQAHDPDSVVYFRNIEVKRLK